MYCDIEIVKNKDQNNLTSNMGDSEIQNFINISQNMINTITKNIFEETYLELNYDELNIYNYDIFVPYPIIRILSVYDSDIEIETKFKKGSRKITSILNYETRHKFSKMVTVKGFFGYEEVPFNIKEACSLMTLWLIQYKDDLSPDIIEEKIDTISVKYVSKLPNQILTLLTDKTRTRMKLI